VTVGISWVRDLLRDRKPKLPLLRSDGLSASGEPGEVIVPDMVELSRDVRREDEELSMPGMLSVVCDCRPLEGSVAAWYPSGKSRGGAGRVGGTEGGRGNMSEGGGGVKLSMFIFTES